MKIQINIKSIVFFTVILLTGWLLFINISFAANTGKITTETARLREQPKTDSEVVELMSYGEEVEILNEKDGWYEVKYKDLKGYVKSDLVAVENKTDVVTNETSQETKQNEDTQPKVEETTVETTETAVIKNEETKLELGKYILKENIKLKIVPLISAMELNEVSKDSEVEVTEILNNWVKIKTADGKQGWMIKKKTVSGNEVEMLGLQATNTNKENSNTTTNTEKTQETKTMYVSSETVNVRKEASKSSEIVTKVSLNTQVTVLSTENGWSYVEVDGQKGYIAENLLSSSKQETSRSNTPRTTQTNTTAPVATPTESATASASGNSVIDYAKTLLGCKYVYGGTTTKGFDCSGFTQYVYKQFGVSLNRTASDQYKNGTAVSELQAGDLVMFGKSGINHVGIYIGGNTFIHAANPSRGVTIDTMASGYYHTNYVGARRVQ